MHSVKLGWYREALFVLSQGVKGLSDACLSFSGGWDQGPDGHHEILLVVVRGEQWGLPQPGLPKCHLAACSAIVQRPLTWLLGSNIACLVYLCGSQPLRRR